MFFNLRSERFSFSIVSSVTCRVSSPFSLVYIGASVAVEYYHREPCFLCLVLPHYSSPSSFFKSYLSHFDLLSWVNFCKHCELRFEVQVFKFCITPWFAYKFKKAVMRNYSEIVKLEWIVFFLDIFLWTLYSLILFYSLIIFSMFIFMPLAITVLVTIAL